MTASLSDVLLWEWDRAGTVLLARHSGQIEVVSCLNIPEKKSEIPVAQTKHAMLYKGIQKACLVSYVFSFSLKLQQVF